VSIKNTLGDLNNHLFAQIERLGDEDLQGEALEQEIKRAEAVTKVSSQIIANGSLLLKARQYYDENYNADSSIPELLTEGKPEKPAPEKLAKGKSA